MFEFSDPTYGPPIGALIAGGIGIFAGLLFLFVMAIMIAGARGDTPEHRIDEITGDDDDGQ